MPIRTLKRKKTKAVSKRDLVKKLDSVFSTYIRTKYSTNGYVKCFTCDIIKPIKEMQNGHYISRMHMSLRWNEHNCHPQCVGCNVFKHGNMDEYAIRLQAKYGEGILKELNRIKNQQRIFTPAELQIMIFAYTKPLN